jgi:hypothetical protein
MNTPSETSIVLPSPSGAKKAVHDLAVTMLTDAINVISNVNSAGWTDVHNAQKNTSELKKLRESVVRSGTAKGIIDSGHYQWYFALLNAARSRDQDAVKKTNDAGPGTSSRDFWNAESVGMVRGTQIRLDQGGPRPRRAADYFNGYYSRLMSKSLSYHPIEPEEFVNGRNGRILADKLGLGIELLASCWPTGRQTLEEVTQSITLLEGRILVGGSDLACFGTTFLNMQSNWSSLCCADHLIHEAAHQSLHAFSEVTPILRNPSIMTTSSPIRADARPLNGTLHATVVFSWLVELCTKVEKLVVEKSLEYERKARLHRHLLGFFQGCDALEQDAEWTDQGRLVWVELTARRSMLIEKLGLPDPQWYEQVPSDYERPSSITMQRKP